MRNAFITAQAVETLKLKAQQLADYLNSQSEVTEDGYVDDPYVNALVLDITQLHDSIIPK